MHVPAYAEVTDRELMEQFIRETTLATIISSGQVYPVATHIPLELEVNESGQKALWGHVSKANPHWKIFEKNPNVLVIYLSPVHHYISSSWYKEPNAPTWNYMSVHVTGKARIITGDKLWESVRRLTAHHEKISENPVSLDTLPESVKLQMNGLVGFEISIEKMEGSFKLSQNRTKEDYGNIIVQLNKSNVPQARAMADILRRLPNQTKK